MPRPYTAPLARDTDPQTSADAALAAEAIIKSHERLILEVLRDRPHGCTGTEIGRVIAGNTGLPMTNVQVMRRMRGLFVAGAVHRRRDRPGAVRWSRRNGETIHYYGQGDMPLWGA